MKGSRKGGAESDTWRMRGEEREEERTERKGREGEGKTHTSSMLICTEGHPLGGAPLVGTTALFNIARAFSQCTAKERRQATIREAVSLGIPWLAAWPIDIRSSNFWGLGLHALL